MKLSRLFQIAILFACCCFASAQDRPNILWISSEDNGPQLGCYGDKNAITPNLDALSNRGMRYTRASSNAPVCAPARTTIITGLYPPSTGAEHMRSMVKLPEEFKLFPAYLTEAGYHCSNPGKEDYNVDKGSFKWAPKGKKKPSWQARGKNQPFFAIYNFTTTHESKIRNKIDDSDLIHNPADMRVPAYHPDTPEVRRDWAQYYSRITMMDKDCGKVLDALEKDGLAEDTIIFYWGDHGSGMPRSKRWPYNSGLHVPLIVHFPKKWQHLAPKEYQAGGTSDRMVSFVDFAPTMLSICGIKPKSWMQGHAFAGEHQIKSPAYSFGFRGRMDERVDLVRTVMDQRYVYLRHYMPHRIYGQYVQYMFQTSTTAQWHQLHQDGKLNEAQSHFWNEKPTEELYDLETDPDEVNNLANSAEHQDILAAMRTAQEQWATEIRDIGFLPESEIHSRSEGSTPHEMGQNNSKYDFETIFAAANLASSKKVEDIPAIAKLLKSKDSAVRYWGAQGLLIHKQEGVHAGASNLIEALKDPSPSVAIVTAEALALYGDKEHTDSAIKTLLTYGDKRQSNEFEAILAVNALDYLDHKAKPYLEEIKALPTEPLQAKSRNGKYIGNLVPKLVNDISK